MALTLFLGNSNTTFFDPQPPAVIAKKFLEDSALGSASISFTCTIGTDNTALFVNRGNPGLGNPDWETGDWTVEVNITTALAGAQARVRLHRYNNDGTVLLESSAFTAFQNINTTGVKSFTFTAEDWNAGGAIDRLAVEIEFHPRTTTGTVAFQVGTTNAEVITPLNVGTAFRVSPAIFDMNPVSPSLTLLNAMSVSPAIFDLNPVAPSLTLPVSLSVSPAILDLNPVAPSLDLLYALNVSPAIFDLNPVAPSLDLLNALSISPAVFDLNPVGPSLDLPLSLAISPAVMDLNAVAPSLALLYALNVTPAVFDLNPVSPSLDLSVDLQISPAIFVLVAVAIRLDFGVSFQISLTRSALLALQVDHPSRLDRLVARPADLSTGPSAETLLSRMMVRSATLTKE